MNKLPSDMQREIIRHLSPQNAYSLQLSKLPRKYYKNAKNVINLKNIVFFKESMSEQWRLGIVSNFRNNHTIVRTILELPNKTQFLGANYVGQYLTKAKNTRRTRRTRQKVV